MGNFDLFWCVCFPYFNFFYASHILFYLFSIYTGLMYWYNESKFLSAFDTMRSGLQPPSSFEAPNVYINHRCCPLLHLIDPIHNLLSLSIHSGVVTRRQALSPHPLLINRWLYTILKQRKCEQTRRTSAHRLGGKNTGVSHAQASIEHHDFIDDYDNNWWL